MITTEKTVDDLPSWKVNILSIFYFIIQLLLSGGIGGIAYWSLTYPADVIKSTMQTDSTIKEESTNNLIVFLNNYNKEIF